LRLRPGPRLDAPQPKVSRHLSYLRAQGLSRPKDGLVGLLPGPPRVREKNEFHKKLLECPPPFCFSDVPEVRGDAQALKKEVQARCEPLVRAPLGRRT